MTNLILKTLITYFVITEKVEVCYSKRTLEKIDENVEVCCSTFILNNIEVCPFEVGVHVPLNYDCNKNQQKNKDLDLDKLGRFQRRKLM